MIQIDEKVVIYITSSDKLLVFVHGSDTDPINEAGLQVPAGTIEKGELAEAAARREAVEETGLKNLEMQGLLGDAFYDMRPYGETIHRRQFFWFKNPSEPIEEWTHIENSGGTGPDHIFNFYWLPIAQCHVLAAGEGAMLGALSETMVKQLGR